MNQAVLNILIVVGIIVAAAAILKAKGLLKFKPLVDEFDINLCEYTIHGGPDKRDFEISLKRTLDYDFILNAHGIDEETGREIYESYHLPLEVMDEFKHLYTSYDVESWGNLSYSEEPDDNAPTEMVKFETPYVRTTFYSNMVFPEGKKKIFEDTYKLLNKYRKRKHISEK
ncbi:MAG: hypothetical protein IJG50_02085 [Clostridia bacterium]|nr:hypothetical protein [Clostridia bacterium]